MELAALDFSGRTTFVTGPGRGCGKTTFLNFALGLLRAAGEAPGFLGIGLEGESRSPAEPFRRARERERVDCLPGELFVTARGYLADTGCSPEIVDVLPGSSALGRLAVVRARRAGSAVLVGPEGNAATALAVESIRAAIRAASGAENRGASVLVDGAINRITQISSIPDARFVYVLRAGAGELAASARAVRRMAALAALPRLGEAARGGDGAATAAAGAAGLPSPAAYVDGPLTASTLARVPKSAATIVVEDLTKVFLEESELASLRRGRALATAAGLGFLGFVAILRDLPRALFARELGDPSVEALVRYNPYEAAEGERA